MGQLRDKQLFLQGLWGVNKIFIGLLTMINEMASSKFWPDVFEERKRMMPGWLVALHSFW